MSSVILKRKTKKASYKKGIRAETYAAWFLRFQGFHIAARRFKTRFGEIDLIARRGSLVLIVEVKARATVAEAMEAISLNAEQRIAAAADYWLSQQADHARLCLRFDLIAICPRKFPVQIANCFGA